MTDKRPPTKQQIEWALEDALDAVSRAQAEADHWRRKLEKLAETAKTA